MVAGVAGGVAGDVRLQGCEHLRGGGDTGGDGDAITPRGPAPAAPDVAEMIGALRDAVEDA